MKHVHSEKGFTLIEIILSILILSIISGVVIQLYIAANQLSDRAKETDLAIITAGNAIELLKHYDNPFMVTEHGFFALAESDRYSMDAFINEGSFDMVLYYDKDFVSCYELEAWYKMEIILGKTENEAMGTLPMEENVINESELLDIQIIVTKLEDDFVLAEHQLSHFYAYVR